MEDKGHLFQMKPLAYWLDAYQNEELSEEEKKALFDFLNTNQKAKDEWVSLVKLDTLLQEKAASEAFKNQLTKHRQENKKSAGTNRIGLFRYWKQMAAAAVIAISASAITWSLVGTQSIKQSTNEYQQLRKEMDNIRNSQVALIRDINEQKNKELWESRYLGSGFNIHNDGYIITSYHVVKDAEEIKVENHAGDRFDAYLVAFENNSDIAILRINDSNYISQNKTLPFLLDTANAQLAENIFSLGYPSEHIVYHEGYISSAQSYARNVDAYLLELTADPGQSGAPVFNQQGNIIGMISGKQSNTAGKTYAIQMRNILNLMESLPEDNQIKISQQAKLKNLNRTQQVANIEEYIYSIKVK